MFVCVCFFMYFVKYICLEVKSIGMCWNLERIIIVVVVITVVVIVITTTTTTTIIITTATTTTTNTTTTTTTTTPAYLPGVGVGLPLIKRFTHSLVNRCSAETQLSHTLLTGDTLLIGRYCKHCGGKRGKYCMKFWFS